MSKRAFMEPTARPSPGTTLEDLHNGRRRIERLLIDMLTLQFEVAEQVADLVHSRSCGETLSRNATLAVEKHQEKVRHSPGRPLRIKPLNSNPSWHSESDREHHETSELDGFGTFDFQRQVSDDSHVWNSSEGNAYVLALKKKVGAFLHETEPARLPDNWPESIELRPELQHECKERRSLMRSVSRDVCDCSTSRSVNQHFFIIHPRSVARITLDIFSSALLIVDLTLTPLVLAWDVPIRGGLLVFSLSVATFWIGDLCVNFLTAYTSEDGSSRHGPTACDQTVPQDVVCRRSLRGAQRLGQCRPGIEKLRQSAARALREAEPSASHPCDHPLYPVLPDVGGLLGLLQHHWRQRGELHRRHMHCRSMAEPSALLCLVCSRATCTQRHRFALDPRGHDGG